MCGIIGYVGDRAAGPIVEDGLRSLEYRGYDSAGVALHEGDLRVEKCEGEVADLDVPESDARCAIGHTRWSTHGPPTDENAHPHTDCSGAVAVVHNGIIENYERLEADLRAAGHTFASETDTEVVPHLIEEAFEEGADSLLDAVQAVLPRLEGSFAICAVAEDEREIVVAREDSPLVVGHGDGETFVASDVPAFVDHTREVTYLENGDVARLTADDVTVYREGTPVRRERDRVEWDADAAERGGYEHYMRKEIHEQPRALRKTLSGRVDEAGRTADLDLDLPEQYLQSLEEVQLVACGTSYHAGLYAKRLFERYAEVPASVTIASEYEFAGGRDPWRTLVVAVTQSGETADTLSAMRNAARAGARTLAVTNTVGSTAAREADDVLYVRAGPEISVAATKTFAAQVTALGLLATYLGRERETLSRDDAGDLLASLQDLPGAVQQVLDEESRVEEAATEYGDAEAFFFIGRALGYPVALEGALKLKEIAYVHAEGFAAGELKHGSLALVTEDTPVLAVLTDGAAPQATLNNVKEVESRGAPVLGATSFDRAGAYLDVEFEVPEIGPFEPLVSNVYLQLFAYHVADHMDRPIDKPRNLAKSVTVE